MKLRPSSNHLPWGGELPSPLLLRKQRRDRAGRHRCVRPSAPMPSRNRWPQPLPQPTRWRNRKAVLRRQRQSPPADVPQCQRLRQFHSRALRPFHNDFRPEVRHARLSRWGPPNRASQSTAGPHGQWAARRVQLRRRRPGSFPRSPLDAVDRTRFGDVPAVPPDGPGANAKPS